MKVSFILIVAFFLLCPLPVMAENSCAGTLEFREWSKSGQNQIFDESIRSQADKVFADIQSGKETLQSVGKTFSKGTNILFMDDASFTSDRLPNGLSDLWYGSTGQVIEQDIELSEKGSAPVYWTAIAQILKKRLDSEKTLHLRLLLFKRETLQWIPTELNILHLRNPISQTVEHSNPVWRFRFNEEGKKLFADITKRNTGKKIGIFFHNELLSTPRVSMEITTGTADLTIEKDVRNASILLRKLKSARRCR